MQPRRATLVGAVGVALLGATLTGCGIGARTTKEQISQTATGYLHALADGDTAKACSFLTVGARGAGCQLLLHERMARIDPRALDRAADDSMSIHVEGDRAIARLSTPSGAR